MILDSHNQAIVGYYAGWGNGGGAAALLLIFNA